MGLLRRAWCLPLLVGIGLSSPPARTKVAGPPGKIFISLPSFRDPLCPRTIGQALARARHPARLVFGVVDQSYLADLPCLAPLAEDQLRREWIAPDRALGPTWARHRAELLYRGERWAMQMDAHMVFSTDWDVKLEAQWAAARNEMAVLTSYPTSFVGSLDNSSFRSLRRTTPVMCTTQHPMVHTDGNQDGLLRLRQATEIDLSKVLPNPAPLLHPFFAAGLSFSAGHRILAVPYDPGTPMLFQGEEMAMTARLWTSGYDLYAFSHSIIFHVYPSDRPKLGLGPVPVFNKQQLSPADQRARVELRRGSAGRVRRLLAGQLVGNFSLGSVRRLPLLWGLLRMGQKGSLQNICPAVLDGTFHRLLQQYKTPTGIDFSAIPAARLRQIEEALVGTSGPPVLDQPPESVRRMQSALRQLREHELGLLQQRPSGGAERAGELEGRVRQPEQELSQSLDQRVDQRAERATVQAESSSMRQQVERLSQRQASREGL